MRRACILKLFRLACFSETSSNSKIGENIWQIVKLYCIFFAFILDDYRQLCCPLLMCTCSYLKLCRERFVLMTVHVYSLLAGDKLLTTTGQFVIRLTNIRGMANFRTSTLSPFLVWISSRNSVFASLREKFHC